MEILKGAYEIFSGKEIDLTITAKTARVKVDAQAETDIEFGYCTEYIIMLKRNFNIKQEIDFKAFLESVGDSIVVVTDDDLVKVHVHTNDPGLVIQKALKYGALSSIKIDNMHLEHQESLFGAAQNSKKPAELFGAEDKPRKKAGFIAVSAGAGINDIFTGLGVDYLIEGGQTMNPSTEDILNAIGKVNAEHIYLLPNNKNIILAANQAATLIKDKKVIVLPTKTVPQGIAAIISHVPDLDVAENTENMNRELLNVRTGLVTYAVRDTVIADKEIKQGDFMGLSDDGIRAVGADVADVTYQMVAGMADDDNELISIYYGAEINEEDAKALQKRIQDDFTAHDVELQYGGQPIYYYIVSVE